MKRLSGTFFSLVLALQFVLAVNPSVASATTGDSDKYFNIEANTASIHNYGISTHDSAFHFDNAFSWEMWLYPTDACSGAVYCHIIVKENEYALGINSGVFQYALNGTGGGWTWVSTTITPRLNTWQHIALTRAAGSDSVTFWLNGDSVFTGVANTLGTGSFMSSSFNFQVGARTTNANSLVSTPAQSYRGSIDELKMWNINRTQSEIQSDMNNYGPVNNSALQVYFDFNDSSGTTIVNKASGAGAGSTLTIRNSPIFSSVETTTVTSGTKVVTFPRTYLSANGWKAPVGITSINALVVGGGGGAGHNSGGGGSGGGVIESTFSASVSAYFPIVGTGGTGNTGGVFPFAASANGETSTVGGIIAPGGNSGFNYKNPEYYPASGGASVNGYGAGGRGSTSGANAVAGSSGLSSSITGAPTFFGGGGGGGGWGGDRNGGAGGSGGGGAGSTSGNGTSGLKNTGGGGGANATSGTIAGNGGSGVIILSFNAFSGSASAITNAIYRTATTLSVTVSEAGKVSFFANGKVIPGCKSRSTVAGSTITASCTWRPSQRGAVPVTARFTPTASPSNFATINVGSVFIAQRTAPR